MTPLQIEILFHCCVIEPSGLVASRDDEAITFLLNNGLVEASGNYYTTTDKGDAFVSYICSLPLPVEKWTIEP